MSAEDVSESSEVNGRARVSGVVLLRADGAALLQHRDEKPGISAPGQWVFPGGHCEPEESDREGAVREFFEETGYRCGEGMRALVGFDYECSETGRGMSLSFWVERYDGVSEVRCFEGQEVRFVTLEEAGGLRRPSYLLWVWERALGLESPPLPGA